MRQVRHNVFETNSSSTHSIVIPKSTTYSSNYVKFAIDEFGWENSCVYDTATYLYTAILDAYPYETSMDKLEQLKTILDSRSIKYEFEEPRWDEYESGNRYLNYGYIDHANELRDFIETILNDEEMLLRYLFAGCVYTGNDNQDTDFARCDIAFKSQRFYNTITKKWEEEINPYHDAENYDYFYKGN